MIRRAVMPDWWEWELRLTRHVLLQMTQRGFNEVDLRGMLHEPGDLLPDRQAGRWVVLARWQDKDWKVVVEPDSDRKVVWVLTAFPV